MGLWHWNIWTRNTFIPWAAAIHINLFTFQDILVHKFSFWRVPILLIYFSVQSNHLSGIYFCHKPLRKLILYLWRKKMKLQCYSLLWGENSSFQPLFFFLFGSSSHFLDKYTYYSLYWRSLSKNPFSLCYYLPSSTNMGHWSSGENWYLSESLCIIFQISSQPGGVDHGQKLHSKFFIAPEVKIAIKSTVSFPQSSFITHLMRVKDKDKRQLWNSLRVDVNSENVWVCLDVDHCCRFVSSHILIKFSNWDREKGNICLDNIVKRKKPQTFPGKLHFFTS